MTAKKSHNITLNEPQPEKLSAIENNAGPNSPIPEQIFLTFPTDICSLEMAQSANQLTGSEKSHKRRLGNAEIIPF